MKATKPKAKTKVNLKTNVFGYSVNATEKAIIESRLKSYRHEAAQNVFALAESSIELSPVKCYDEDGETMEINEAENTLNLSEILPLLENFTDRFESFLHLETWKRPAGKGRK